MAEFKLPTFYWDSKARVGIDSAKPKRMDMKEALLVLRKLSSKKSFLGFRLPETWILQFYIDTDDLWHVEHLKEGSNTAQTCNLNVPLAELLIRAVYDGKRASEALVDFPIEWTSEQLWE